MNFRQIHLDFHTSEKIDGIGKSFSKKQFQEALLAGHVNSITVFSKCHHGWAYHPSNANEMHPGLNFDLLKCQIEAAHEIGVKTPVYLSVGNDERMARLHPEWLVCYNNPEFKQTFVADFSRATYHILCLNTPYQDILLAQIEEVCKRYDADGIFLDISAVRKCTCPTCTAQMLREGKDPTDPAAITELAERVFANYSKRVRETIDAIKPSLPVFHNGGHIVNGRRDLADANSHLEIESLPTGHWGYDHFPFSVRYAQGLGKELVGMTGKFHESWGEFGGFKHKNALRYEVALSAANGAKCSIGDQLAPNGEMDMATYKLIAPAYKELEEKEPWLDGVSSVADVALFSAESAITYYNSTRSSMVTTEDAGAVRILLEGHYLFDVVDYESDFDLYKVLILPDSVRLDEKLKTKIAAFIANGGKVLASGTSALEKDNERFSLDLGAEFIGENPFSPSYLRPNFEIFDMETSDYVIYADGYEMKTTGKELASRRNPFFNRTAQHFCSHRHAPSSGEYGGGGITMGADGVYIAWNIFTEYATRAPLIAKRVVMYALDILLGENKTLTTSLPSLGITTLQDQKSKKRLVCHTIYAAPVKRGNGISVIEDLIPVYNTDMSIKADKTIKKVYLAPSGENLHFHEENGRISFTVPKIDCWQMTVLDYE